MTRPDAETIRQAIQDSGGYKPAVRLLREQGYTTSEGHIRRTVKPEIKTITPEKFELPPGHLIKGVSAYVDPDGNILSQWIKTKQSEFDANEAIKTAFDEYKGLAKLPSEPKYTNTDLATFYNLADHHLGLYSWKKETGDNYDLNIAEKLLIDSMSELVAMAPHSDQAIILGLGDFFHSDNSENKTLRSGNALDVDTRYAKVLSLGVKLKIATIELALQKHRKVLVRVLPGNHDPHSSLALTVALDAFFSRNDRVTIDCDPSLFFHWTFGQVMVSATHGHTVKPTDMPGIMAARRPQEWGATKYRYSYLGHVHHSSVGGGEAHGVRWETFQSLTAKDAWHAGQKYSSGRSMVAITHDMNRGERFRQTVAL